LGLTLAGQTVKLVVKNGSLVIVARTPKLKRTVAEEKPFVVIVLAWV